jgi:CubicO group peptidase (beta-lactamase class C family)
MSLQSGVLARLGVLAVLSIMSMIAPWSADEVKAQSSGPRFRTDGVDADAFGWSDGYPSCTKGDYVDKQRCRVGTFSKFDALYPSRAIAASKGVSRLLRAPKEPAFRYMWGGRELTVDDYLDRQPVTGFLIARDDTILLERYQYARTDKQRLTSFSMTKTLVALLAGVAAKDGLIRSINDPAERYAPELSGTAYGKTPIKALLQMSSGVAFNEDYGNAPSDFATLYRATLLQEAGGSPAALKRFNTRPTPPGERWSYSSADTSALGLVVAGATRRNLSDYLREKVWEPLGAEAPASWPLDATGREVAYGYFNATLRDWARIGLMLAYDGTWNGKDIVPREWVITATKLSPGDPHLRFSARYWAGYGYQTWLIPGANHAFALQGNRGQFVMVDPIERVVLVQTAARAGSDMAADRELLALFAAVSAHRP